MIDENVDGSIDEKENAGAGGESTQSEQGSESSEQKETAQIAGPAADLSEVEDRTVVKEVDLKGIHFSIVKRGEGFEVKRDNEVVGRDLKSVDDAGRFIHVFCYGASTV